MTGNPFALDDKAAYERWRDRKLAETDAQLDAAVASLADFTEPYQASVLHPQPLFRRVARVGVKA